VRPELLPMKLAAETELQIARPPADVYDAWADPAKLAKYFITTGSGRLEKGATVVWRWADFGNAEATVKVLEAEPGVRLKFTWAGFSMESTVEATFEARDGGTRVHVREGEWEGDEAGIKRLAQQTQGWVNMLLCLKAYLVYGIDLRRG